MPVEISYYKGNNYFAVDNRKYGTKSSTGMKNARACGRARAFFYLIVVLLNPTQGVVEEGDEVAGDAGDDGVYQTGHHERVVQQVLADDGSA